MEAENAREEYQDEESKTEPDGFTAQERAAMQERAAELRAEGKKGAKKAEGLQALLDSIASMAPADRELAEQPAQDGEQGRPRPGSERPGDPRCPTRTRTARSSSSSRTPASSTTAMRPWASRTPRTSTTATSGPPSYALAKWTPAVEKKVTELVKAAIS